MADEWMDKLAQAARDRADSESQRLDPRWRAWTHGELSPDDEATLQREASTPRDVQALEAFRPVDATIKARIVEQARAQLPAHQHVDPLPEPSQATQRAQPLRWLLPLAATLALTMGIVQIARDSSVPSTPVTSEAFPRYQMSLAGERATVRSTAPPAEETVATFGRHSVLAITLLPHTASEGHRPAVALVWDREGNAQPLLLPPDAVEHKSGGTIEIRAVIGRDLRPEPGTGRLLVVVGPPGALPTPTDLVAAPRTDEQRDLQVFQHRVTFLDESPAS